MKNGQEKYLSKRVRSMLTFPGEEVILLEREHWSVLIAPVFLLMFLYIFFIFVSSYISTALFNSILAALAIGVLITIITITLFTKIVIDWYFHMYIITNRKFLEVLYSPLFSDQINDILLSQVKCTEVDANIPGIFKQMLDVGDVVIAFDKLAPHEEFVLKNVKFPRKISMFLADQLSSMEQTTESQNYYADRYRQPYAKNVRLQNVTGGGEFL